MLFNPDGGTLSSAGDDGRILRWSMPAGERMGEPWQAPAEVWALALSPDGKTLASGNRGAGITLWSIAEGKVIRTLKGRTSSIADGKALAYTPDGHLLSGGYNGEVGLWDPATGRERVLARIHADEVDAVAVSPDGRYLATGGTDKRIVLWRLEREGARPLRLLQGHGNKVMGLRFTPDGRLLSASYDNTMRLWDPASGTTLRIYQGHRAGLWSIALHGTDIYTAANDGTVRRWTLGTLNQWLWELPGEPISAAISPDAAWVSVGFSDGALRMYRLPGGAEATSPTDAVQAKGGVGLRGAQPNLQATSILEVKDAHSNAHNNQILRQAYSADGSLLATSSHDHTAKLWRMEQGPDGPRLTRLHTLDRHGDSVHALAFSPDGRRLATAGYDGRVGVFDVGSGKGELFVAHEGKVASVAFDQTGKHLLTAGYEDSRLRLWDLTQTPPRPRDLARAQDRLLWAALGPDDWQVAAVGRTQYVTLYDLAPDPAPPGHLVGHEQAVFRAAYTPDGAQLATVSSDMTLRLWDLGRDKPLFSLHLPATRERGVPLWDFALRCLPADASGPHAGHCWIAVPLTMGRLALYRLPYQDPPDSLGP